MAMYSVLGEGERLLTACIRLIELFNKRFIVYNSNMKFTPPPISIANYISLSNFISKFCLSPVRVRAVEFAVRNTVQPGGIVCL